MAFKVHKGKGWRMAECEDMFNQLAEGESLVAVVDMSSANVHVYAKKLGRKVKTSVIDDTHCKVWLVKEADHA